MARSTNARSDTEAYSFRASGRALPEPAEWRVGEVRFFERVKIRNEAGEHVANGFELVGVEND
jgi:hypothetical protein